MNYIPRDIAQRFNNKPNGISLMPHISLACGEILALCLNEMSDGVKKTQLISFDENVQEILDSAEYYAKDYFSNGRLPASTASALLMMSLGVDLKKNKDQLQQTEVLRGIELLKGLEQLETRITTAPDLSQEQDPWWRELMFIRQYQLADGLSAALDITGMLGKCDPRTIDEFSYVEDVIWPECELTLHNKLAMYKICHTVTCSSMISGNTGVTLSFG